MTSLPGTWELNILLRRKTNGGLTVHFYHTHRTFSALSATSPRQKTKTIEAHVLFLTRIPCPKRQAASMQTRPCFSSASLSHFTCTFAGIWQWRSHAKPSGIEGVGEAQRVELRLAAREAAQVLRLRPEKIPLPQLNQATGRAGSCWSRHGMPGI